jgi:hypothetical protein
MGYKIAEYLLENNSDIDCIIDPVNGYSFIMRIATYNNVNNQ